MSRAWQETALPERLGEARPGALLSSAAAVPLGAALVVAAGLLPAGARAVLGVALLVLGLRVRALAGTTIGARIRPWTARAVGTASVVGGAVVSAAAVAVALDGGEPGREGAVAVASRFMVPVVDLGAVPAAVLGALLAGAGAALVLLDRGGTTLPEGAAPRAPTAAAPSAGGPGGVARLAAGSASTAGAVLAGLGAAVAVLALLGPGALGLGADGVVVVVVLVALVGTVAVARSTPANPWARAAGVAAGVLLCLLIQEATGLATALLGAGVGPVARDAPGAVVAAVGFAATVGVAAALVVLAARRGDALLAVAPGAFLLRLGPASSGVEQVGLLVVPVLLVALAVAGFAGVGSVAARVPRPARPAVLAVALVVLLAALVGAFGDGVDPAGLFRHEDVVLAAVCVLGLAVVVDLARTSEGAAGEVVALSGVLGLYAVHPLVLVRAAVPGALGGWAWIVVVLAAEVGLATVLARRRPSGPVLAAVGLLMASALHTAAYALGSEGPIDDEAVLVGVTLGLAIVAVVLASAIALAGPARTAGRAQALAAGLAVGTLVFGVSVAGFLGPGGTDDGAAAPLAGGPAVLAVLLLGLAGLGVALLAASTARRPSAPVAAVAAISAAALGLLTGAVGAAVVSGAPTGEAALGLRLLDAAVGFDASGSRLALASGAWPALFGFLGAVLLATAAWLESRRPLPPDAPLG